MGKKNFFLLFILFYFLTLQYCIGFAIKASIGKLSIQIKRLLFQGTYTQA